MLAVYLNYPNPTISAHPGKTSVGLKKQYKADQRFVHIDAVTLSEELLRFRDNAYKFAANTALNDMWIDIDFDDLAFEMAVVAYVQRLLGKHYAPFASVQIQSHA